MVRYILPLNRFCTTVTCFPLELVVMVVPLGPLLPPIPKHPWTLNATSSNKQIVIKGVYFCFFIVISNLHSLRRFKDDCEQQIEQAVETQHVITAARVGGQTGGLPRCRVCAGIRRWRSLWLR